jgi:hypothetical protein
VSDGALSDASTDVSSPDDSGADAPDDAPVADANLPETSYACVTAPTSCPTPAVTYADVQGIFAERCAVCHSGGRPSGMWPLTEYSHVVDWREDIRAFVLNCIMPPADAGVPITVDERIAILNFIKCGLLP